MMTLQFDDVLQLIGEFGKYQKIQLILICLITIVSAFLSLNMVFVGGLPDHHCKITEDIKGSLQNATDIRLSEADIKAIMLPKEISKEREIFSRCHMYNLTKVINKLRLDPSRLIQNASNIFSNEDKVMCQHGWWYDPEVYGETLVSEWDLVCDKKYIKDLSKSLFFGGRLVGALVSGAISDRIGRKPVFLIAVSVSAAMGIIAAFSVNMTMFLVSYFLQGSMQCAVYLTIFVMGTELVGPNYRKLSGILVPSLYSVGFMLLPAIAFGLKNWRHLELAISIPGFLFLIYYWFVPESMRWLINKGEIDRAKVILKKAAKMNGVGIDVDILHKVSVKKDQDKSARPKTTWKDYGILAKYAFNIFFNWVVNSLVYYGLSLNSENIGGNVYLNIFLQGAVEIPAHLICVILLDKTGRRPLLVVLMFFSGICCLATGFIPQRLLVLSITLASLGKLGITASYDIIYLWSSEIFPTEVRNLGMGLSSMSARIGGIFAPIVLISEDFYQPLPLIIFGGLALAGGFLALFLPESSGKAMPEWIAEIKTVFKNNKSENTNLAIPRTSDLNRNSGEPMGKDLSEIDTSFERKETIL